jgi:hypothetical protein
MKSVIAAFIAYTSVIILRAIFFYRPIEQADAASETLFHPALAIIDYTVLIIVLYYWVTKQIGNAYKAAFIIAASQFILVNVDFVFRGKRGMLTAAASGVLMAAPG